MTLAITPWYAAVLTVLFLVLSARVSLRRGKADALFGDGGDDELMRRIRAHGNFAEYVPLALLLMAVAEAKGAAHWALTLLGALLVVGRILHPVALAGFGGMPVRAGGMMMTWAALALGALICVL